jgi:hypothetical protein
MKSKKEIEQLATNKYGTSIYSIDEVEAFKEGYTQCQEDNAENKYTEEDIKEMACDFVINVGGLPEDLETWQTALWKFYQHLNKQD